MAPLRIAQTAALLLWAICFLLLQLPASAEESAGFQGSLEETLTNFDHAGTDDDPCEPSNVATSAGTPQDPYIFETFIDHFASSTGYYKFKFCGPTRKPTLKMKAGSTYKFVQEHVSNWMHPLGYAYYPDGAHAEGRGLPFDELEPALKPPSGGDDSCEAGSTCQTPEYYGGPDGTTFLGKSGDSGLDVYEPQFKYPHAFWTTQKYNVRLTITDPKTAEIYYFCHIHNWMTGRIIVTNEDGSARSKSGYESTSPLYPPVELNKDDETCGYTPAPNFGDPKGPSAFKNCAQRALCGSNNLFKKCLEAVDCHMTENMRVTHSGDPIKTFMRQMIPHHQNAVNMAKVLLKTAKADVDKVDADAGEDAFLNELLQSIINVQNGQIMTMYDYLAEEHGKDGKVDVYDGGCNNNIGALDHYKVGWAYFFGGALLICLTLAILYYYYVIYKKQARIIYGDEKAEGKSPESGVVPPVQLAPKPQMPVYPVTNPVPIPVMGSAFGSA